MQYPKYVPSHEHAIVLALVNAMLEGGNSVSVYDTEDFVIQLCTDAQAIIMELGGAEEDQLIGHDSDGNRLGWFYLIYNNGSEGDPMVVIADYEANPWCDAINNKLTTRFEG